MPNFTLTSLSLPLIYAVGSAFGLILILLEALCILMPLWFGEVLRDLNLDNYDLDSIE
jgi:hypothetical protein